MDIRKLKLQKRLQSFFEELGLNYRSGLALTGVKAKLKNESKGPNVAILSELDGVICFDSPKADKKTGATHTCGHHLQMAAMLGAALGLKKANIENELYGNVTFMAVPSEEYIEIAYRSKLKEEGKVHFLAGKQELIYNGEFDDVDIAMMFHSLKNLSNSYSCDR